MTSGDANCDRVVDDLDLTVLATAWPDGGLSVSAVPEPATLGLLVLGGLALVCKKRNCAPRVVLKYFVAPSPRYGPLRGFYGRRTAPSACGCDGLCARQSHARQQADPLHRSGPPPRDPRLTPPPADSVAPGEIVSPGRVGVDNRVLVSRQGWRASLRVRHFLVARRNILYYSGLSR